MFYVVFDYLTIKKSMNLWEMKVHEFFFLKSAKSFIEAWNKFPNYRNFKILIEKEGKE